MKNNIIKKWNKFPLWAKLLLIESVPLIILIFAIVIEVGHLAHSDWLNTFLYNSDSLTLPLIRQSIAHKEPFLWIFSSQLFLFPEGVFYFISSVLTTSIRSSLVFNVFLNVLVLYVLIRGITKVTNLGNKILQILFSLFCCLLLIFDMLLEKHALVNQSSIATLFILTAYYYGVTLSGLALLWISLVQLKQKTKILVKSSLITLLIGNLIGLFATFSDPLFLVEIIAPFILVILLILLLNNIKLRQAIRLFILAVPGSLIGYVLRIPFKDFVGQSLNSHVSITEIPYTLTVLHGSLHTMLHSKSGLLELISCFGVLLLVLIFFILLIHRNAKKPGTYPASLILITAFALAVTSVCIIFTVVTGSKVTRYLLPIFIFPLVGLMPILDLQIIKKLQKQIVNIGIIIAIVVITVGIFSIPKAIDLLSTSNFNTSTCLENALNNQPANGIAQYWTSRALDVYGKSDERVLQVNNNFMLYPWLANLGAYENKQFTFIVIDNSANNTTWNISPSNLAHIGQPYRQVTCRNVQIYIYKPGSTGYKTLNADIQKSYSQLLKIRKAGDMGNYFSDT